MDDLAIKPRALFEFIRRFEDGGPFSLKESELAHHPDLPPYTLPESSSTLSKCT